MHAHLVSRPTGDRPVDPDAARHLVALFDDAEFPKLIDRATTEVMRIWNLPRDTAVGFVISAMGDPKTLASIHDEWAKARTLGKGLGLPKLIVRRRASDLLRGDARRPHHESLPPTSDDLGVLADRTRHSSCDPHEQAELNQIAALVHEALRSFAEQGPTQARQAWLVRCRVFDELSYAELAERTACSSGALRVRIHKALQALRRHIETHPELAELLGCTAGRQRT